MQFVKKLPKRFLLILFIITIVNILQGRFTELIGDEAYYWVFSKFLDWSYFDHPPLVAVWISISKLFFESTELSVRFFSAIAYSFGIILVWKTIDIPEKRNHVKLFFLLVLSSVVYSIYGFITTPDTPLVFFLALFLYGYKIYISKRNPLSYILIIIAVAGLLYSKYQGILIVFFVFLSNVKVLKDYKIWISFLAVIILFSPHLYWQYQHDFISFKYHLFERSSHKYYKFSYTINHFLNCLVLVGLTFPLVYYAAYKNLKNKDLFNRALNFLIIGFIIFFFLMSFKGNTQAQWIVPISIPLILISFNYFAIHKKKYALLKNLSLITIAITIILRIFSVVDIIPKKLEFHGNKKWVATLQEKLTDKVPLFVGSYRNASLYWFYSGKRSYLYNNIKSRNNQYDFYDYNKFYNFNKALIIGVPKESATDSMQKKRKDKLYVRQIDNLKLNNNLSIKYLEPTELSFGKNSVAISIENELENFSIKENKFLIYFYDKTKKEIFSTALNFNFEKENLPVGTTTTIMEFTLPPSFDEKKFIQFRTGIKFNPDVLGLLVSKSYQKFTMK